MEAPTLDEAPISVPVPFESSLTPVVPTTTSTSEAYQHRLAEITSRATLSDPLNVLIQREKNGPLTPVTASQLYDGCMIRIKTKVAAGALIVEAADFAAVACWEPPQDTPPELSEDEFRRRISREGRPIYTTFLRDLQTARQEVFGEHARFWTLSLMARDPDRKDKGAVRAVIEPFLEKARLEGLPIWLVAGNARARDVYAYFGFRVVKVLRSGLLEGTRREGGPDSQDETIVETWCMVANWPPEKVGTGN